MKSNIIEVYEGRLVLGTFNLSKLLNMTHPCLKKCINKYVKGAIDPIVERTVLTHKKGGQIRQYLLSVDQVICLCFFLPTHPQCRKAKMISVRHGLKSDLEFFKALEDSLLYEQK